MLKGLKLSEVERSKVKRVERREGGEGDRLRKLWVNFLQAR
jgi:hypothetical protein